MASWLIKSSAKRLDKQNKFSESKEVEERLFSLAPLSTSFYSRHTVEVAQDLLGKLLLVRTGGSLTAGRIVETEAYREDDPASHSARGLTPRNSVMFGKPGNAYVYFIYGMYEMLNFVTEPEGVAGAVLIRAVEPVFGIDTMMKRRGMPKTLYSLTSGPGKLCRAMGILMAHNGVSLQGSSLKVCDEGYRPQQVASSSRIGIRLATDKQWRFYVKDHPFVSKVR